MVQKKRGHWRLELVGFDYKAALLRMRQERSYEQLAELCGYASKSGIMRIVNGSEPKHRNGELIHGTFRDLFPDEDVPLRPGQGQAHDAANVHQSGRKRRPKRG